ncbi:MAG: glycosyltransferase [Acidobacteria bacterium]|jgi:hypothetical protein|nr:glycosyltransferase [Acidobacteriota bacterium]
MKRVLVISFSDLKSDPRVNRQIRFLSDDYEVSALGTGDPCLPGVRFVPIQRRRHSPPLRLLRAAAYKLGCYDRLYWSLYDYERPLAALSGSRFDLVIANDVIALPLALRVARGARVMLDAHEYAPSQWENDRRWNFLFGGFNLYLCRTYLPRCDQVLTVSAGIAAAYRENFGVPVEVITNSCEFSDLAPSPPDPGRIRLVHHGNANPNRGLEDMIRLMAGAGADRSLDLILVRTFPRYFRRLQKRAGNDPRISFPDPLPLEAIVPFIHRYDIGICYFKPATFNLLHVLPNKFFEFIQARLAILCGPSPEMADIVRRWDCGVVASDFTPGALAAALAGMDRQRVEYFKGRSHLAARELSAAANRQRLLALARELTGG